MALEGHICDSDLRGSCSTVSEIVIQRCVYRQAGTNNQ